MQYFIGFDMDDEGEATLYEKVVAMIDGEPAPAAGEAPKRGRGRPKKDPAAAVTGTPTPATPAAQPAAPAAFNPFGDPTPAPAAQKPNPMFNGQPITPDVLANVLKAYVDRFGPAPTQAFMSKHGASVYGEIVAKPEIWESFVSSAVQALNSGVAAG